MTNVFANMWQVAGQSGMNKSIARFPDVCLSPPSPPAGPIPIPYPDTSFSTDLKEGSETVKVGGKPAALAQKSYYKPSALGNEAATRSFGASVITHQITGKTYFQAWSMDVKFEGRNVCRHIDITTSNHGSAPPATPPLPTGEMMSVADQQALIAAGTCPCCKGPVHSEAQRTGKRVTSQEWYHPNYPNRPTPKRVAAAVALYDTAVAVAKETGCDGALPNDNPEDPCGGHYYVKAEDSQKARRDFAAQTSPLTAKNYFRNQYGVKVGKKIKLQGRRIQAAMATGKITSVGHKTALAAGGCPFGPGNHAAVGPECKDIEEALATAQNQIAEFHRKVHFP